MGKKLIIQGADFSAHPVGGLESSGLMTTLPFMNSVVSGQAGWLFATTSTNRLTLTGEYFTAIKVPKGYQITLSGLKGVSANQTALWLDYLIYSTPTIPTCQNGNQVTENAPTLIATGSGFDSSNYFPLNHSNDVSASLINTYNYDVYIVFVAKAGSSGSTITLSNYRSSTAGITYSVTKV